MSPATGGYFFDVAKRNTLGKNERLKSRKSIEEIFDKGKSFAIHPIRAYYQTGKAEERPLARLAVSVSKRNFKKAVERNRVKRQMREAYRLQRQTLQDHLEKKENVAIDIFLIYTGKELPEYELISNKIRSVLDRIIKELG